MFSYYPVRNSPLPYSYSPYSYHPRSSLDLERERYMRALAEEQAARDRYTSALERERELQEDAAARHAQAEALRRQHLREPQRRSHPFYASPYGSRYANSSDEECDYPYGPYYNRYRRVGSPYDDNQNTEMPDEYEAYKLKELLKKKELERLMNESVRDRRRKELDEERILRDENLPRKQRISPNIKAEPVARSPSSTPVRIPISDPEPAKPSPAQFQQTAKAKVGSRDPSPDPIDHQVHAVRLAALTTIDALRTQFTSLKNVFVFPTSLDFTTASSPSAINETPRLAYTHTNAPIHAYEDALLKLLQALDAVESAGEREVREKRKEMVKNVEAELALLDEKKVEMWKRVCAEAAPAVEEKMEVDNRQSAEVAEKTVDTTDILTAPTDESLKTDIEDGSAVATEPTESIFENSDAVRVEQSAPVQVQLMEVESEDKCESQKMDVDDVVTHNADIEVKVPSDPTPISNKEEHDQQEGYSSVLQQSQTSEQLDISTLPSTSEPSSPRPAYIREVLAPTSLSEPSSSRPHSPVLSTSSVVDDAEVIEESGQSTSDDGKEDLIVIEETLSNPGVNEILQSNSSSQESISTYPPQAIYPAKIDESEHDNYVMVF